jgi:uncharacterized damage-inducible protein DinB
MKFELPAHPEFHPYLAAIAASVEFAKSRAIRFIKGLSQEQLEATPAPFTNSIATLALHIAATNTYFAHSLRGALVPAELQAEFKLDQPQSPLPAAQGETFDSLVEKLERSTALLVETLGSIENPQIEAEIPFGGENTATNAFLLGVVSLHGHQHIGQIQMLRKALGA